MAEYAQITDSTLQTRVGARYSTEIDSFRRVGFRRLAYCLELLGPFSAILQLPVLLLTLPKREVLVFRWPLRLAVANVLLAHAEPPSIALCMGMGVKLYTAFSNNTLLISSTFQSHAVPGPRSSITKSPPFPTVELAWSGHATRVRQMEHEGRVVRPSLAFEDYVAMSLREEDRSQYL